MQCFDVSPAKRRREIFIFEVLTATRTRNGRSFIICLCMKTIRAKEAKVHFANRPVSYSNGWTGSSMRWRLMRAN